MKKSLWVILLLSLLLVSASPARLVRFDVINKSGLPVALRLNGKALGKFYYLRIPQGNRASPVEMSFTVATDLYITQVYYLEPEQSQDGLRCKQPRPTKLNLIHNVHLVMLECTRQPVYTGEPFMLKFPIRFIPY
jgi:hypothetical protein